jgi:carboxyl-terminal processing protease
MPKRVSLSSIAAAWVICVGVSALAQRATENFEPPSLSQSDRIKAFEKVWKIIDEDFYDPAFNGADWKGARHRYRPRIDAAGNDDEFYRLLDEMLAELRDSHTRFHRPKVYSGKKESASNVGLSVYPVEGSLVVVSVDDDSDGAKAGVRVGMMVRAFDGKPTEERVATIQKLLRQYVGIATERMLMVLTASSFFSGDANTSVTVDFEGEDGKRREVSLTSRSKEDPPMMTAQRLDSGIGYIRFRSWVPPNDKRLREELKKLIDTSALIIDLRGNRGGSFMTADYFLKAGTFTGSTVWRSGRVEKGYSGRSDLNYNGRLVVLVDEESGSASENFAAVIQESGRGLVAGRQTCGCLTSSYFQSVKGGGRLQWSRVLVQTIKGNKIEGVGVTPDVVVPLTLTDLRQGRDAGLEEAKRLLRSQGKSSS